MAWIKDAYTDEDKGLVQQLWKEVKEETCPELKEAIDVEPYDGVSVNSTNWCGIFTAPIRIFLRNVNGKPNN